MQIFSCICGVSWCFSVAEMGKFMKPGKVVMVLAGRYAGRKAVIVKVRTWKTPEIHLIQHTRNIPETHLDTVIVLWMFLMSF